MDDSHEQFIREVAILRRLAGAPGVVKLIDYILDDDPFPCRPGNEPWKLPRREYHHAALVLEYLEPTTTPYYALPSEEAQKDFFRQLCRARDPPLFLLLRFPPAAENAGGPSGAGCV
jgi:serine/threonine protein kinase